jgi:hypothetical protein
MIDSILATMLFLWAGVVAWFMLGVAVCVAAAASGRASKLLAWLEAEDVDSKRSTVRNSIAVRETMRKRSLILFGPLGWL